MKALSLTRAIWTALQRCHVPSSIDTFYPLDNFIDRVSQYIRRYDWFVPDRVLPGFAIEMPLSIDLNVEFESNIVIQARKNCVIRYYSSPDFSAFDHLESFEYFIEYIDRCIFRKWRWKMKFWMLRCDIHRWSFWSEKRVIVNFSQSLSQLKSWKLEAIL